MERNDFIEKIIGGVFAVIAIGAAIIEMFINGVSSVTVVSCVKDVFGTLALVVLLLAFLKDLMPKPVFRGQLETAMQKIEKAYYPLIREHKANETNVSDVAKNEEFIRYDLARNINALFGEECKDYMRFMQIKAVDPDKIQFFVRKKFFGETMDASRIAEHIKGFGERNYPQCEVTYSSNNKDGGADITFSFGKIMCTKDDIALLVDIIDDVLLLFIAEYKKS